MRGHLRHGGEIRRDRRREGRRDRIGQFPRRVQGGSGDRRTREVHVEGVRDGGDRGAAEGRAQQRDRKTRCTHHLPPGGVQRATGSRLRRYPFRQRHSRHISDFHRREVQQAQQGDSTDQVALPRLQGQGVPPLSRYREDVPDLRPGNHRRPRPEDGGRPGALLSRHGQGGHRCPHARRGQTVRPGDQPAYDQGHRPRRAQKRSKQHHTGTISRPALRTPFRGRFVQGVRPRQDLPRKSRRRETVRQGESDRCGGILQGRLTRSAHPTKGGAPEGRPHKEQDDLLGQGRELRGGLFRPNHEDAVRHLRQGVRIRGRRQDAAQLLRKAGHPMQGGPSGRPGCRLQRR